MEGTASSDVDFISNLPHSIIDNILGCLPLWDIVRTSVLSREWRHKWLSCPGLVFDFLYFREHELEPLLYRILQRHQGPLLKFVLYIPYHRVFPDIDQLVRQLPNHSLQDLTLYAPYGEKYRLTPHLLTTFQNLRYLKLRNCAFNSPPGIEGFPKLVGIHLDSCSIVTETLVKFVASCPVIEEMRLIMCSRFDCLEITGPKLKSFKFYGMLGSISFKNCHVLSNVNLSFDSAAHVRGRLYSLDFVKSLCSLPLLENLKLDTFALENLFEYGAPNKLPIALKTLQSLHLFGKYFMGTEEITSVICFIRSCPGLQTLNMTHCILRNVENLVDFLHLQDDKKRLESLTHLKTVKMEIFSGNDCEMEFLKYLLASATALKELSIIHYATRVENRGEILKKLKRYPRASPGAEIRVLAKR